MSTTYLDAESIGHVSEILYAHVGHLLEADRFDALVDELAAAGQ
ncbi:hypothetical protein GCM10010977_02580 [Citricoccus zhacaiensis]|uniref:Uncharacterized protein n=1 Tax=Citricoccus zhacaiensis TaxID=489142 RepID=A0ABQ2LMY6_9MICC|nr:hypothetical protein [Citricoccus zhacaiensis]GGO40371.1 hypothetical protein GCM10010977_02580 [Citricoccus zhacaiensis]